MVDSGTIYILTGKLIIGTLIFIRVMGLMVSGPFFKSQAIMPQMKVFLSAIIALTITTALWEGQPVIDMHIWYLVLLVLKELMVGLAIGFAANTVFWGARMAGGLIDFDMGYQTSTIFNVDESSPTLVGELQFMVTMMIFLYINGHHYLIEGIFVSVRAVPLTTMEFTESTLTFFIRIATTVMILGIKISSPLLVAIFLTNLALALLARVAPQTNIFILSFQMKIVIGLLVLLASAPLFGTLIKYSLQGMETELMQFILTLNPKT